MSSQCCSFKTFRRTNWRGWNIMADDEKEVCGMQLYSRAQPTQDIPPSLWAVLKDTPEFGWIFTLSSATSQAEPIIVFGKCVPDLGIPYSGRMFPCTVLLTFARRESTGFILKMAIVSFVDCKSVISKSAFLKKAKGLLSMKLSIHFIFMKRRTVSIMFKFCDSTELVGEYCIFGLRRDGLGFRKIKQLLDIHVVVSIYIIFFDNMNLQ